MNPRDIELITKYISLGCGLTTDCYCDLEQIYFIPENKSKRTKTTWATIEIRETFGPTLVCHPKKYKEIRKIFDKYKKIQESDLYKAITHDRKTS